MHLFDTLCACYVSGERPEDRTNGRVYSFVFVVININRTRKFDGFLEANDDQGREEVMLLLPFQTNYSKQRIFT
jgi:hypothetical protein